MSLRGDHLLEFGKREPVDDDRGSVGSCGERRCLIRVHRELDNPYPAPAGAQALDNVTVVEIAAGQLIEAARNDKDELTHPSGAS
jgi:hypothetical protein